MSAIATKKPLSDEHRLLTYPAGFQRAYEESGMVPVYFPSYDGTPMDVMVDSTGEQALYHEQKRMEANQSVMNGLQANRTAQEKLLTGPHNYHLPKPVLSQRRYANPSYGAVSFDSTRRDNGAEAPFRTIEVGMDSMVGSGSGELRGGVRTLEGYSFYREQLQRRIGQLDRLNALAQGYAVPMGQEYETRDPTKDGTFAKVQFYTALKALTADILDGDFDTIKVDKNMIETQDYLLKYVPTIEDEEELGDIVRTLGTSRNVMRQILGDDEMIERIQATYGVEEGRLQFIGNFIDRLFDYTIAFLRDENIYLSPTDKKTLSRSLIKQLGFTNVGLRPLQRVGILGRLGESTETGTTTSRGDASTFSSGDSSGFDRPAGSREDSEMSYAPRAPFAGRSGDLRRERFGALGRRGDAGAFYFGEDGGGGGAGEVGIAYPLDMAGFDPSAELGAPEGDTEAILDALITVQKTILEPLETPADKDKELDEIVATHYPQKQAYINEVERAMEERGFSKQQIARAMTEEGSDVYREYIAENTGPIAPARAEPARRFAPPPPPAPLYDDGSGAGAGASGFTGALSAVSRGVGTPTGEYSSPAEFLASIGFPANRDELRIQARSLRDVTRVGALLTPPYVPREGTKLQNAITALIAKVRKIDPSY